MSTNIEVRGQVLVGSSLCGGSGSGPSQCVTSLALGDGCDGGKSFGATVSAKVAIATSGAIGDEFDRLDVLRDLAQIEFVYVKSSARTRLRIDAAPATALGAALAASVTFASETFDATVDGVLVSTTFGAESITPAQIAARINSAAALVDLPPIASIVNGSQILITGVETGVEVDDPTFGGTAQTLVGFSAPTITGAKGADIDVQGIALLSFPPSPNAPARIDASGNATLEIIAGGRSA